MHNVPNSGPEDNPSRPTHTADTGGSEAAPPDTAGARLAPDLAAQVAEHILPALRSELRRVSEPAPLLAIEDVAVWLNVSPRTCEKLVSAGKLTPLWVAGQRRFSRAGVEAYLRSAEGKRHTARKRRPGRTPAEGAR